MTEKRENEIEAYAIGISALSSNLMGKKGNRKLDGILKKHNCIGVNPDYVRNYLFFMFETDDDRIAAFKEIKKKILFSNVKFIPNKAYLPKDVVEGNKERIRKSNERYRIL